MQIKIPSPFKLKNMGTRIRKAIIRKTPPSAHGARNYKTTERWWGFRYRENDKRTRREIKQEEQTKRRNEIKD